MSAPVGCGGHHHAVPVRVFLLRSGFRDDRGGWGTRCGECFRVSNYGPRATLLPAGRLSDALW
ncbi:hypothetical protein SGM_1060 [Streptomyces griseoaurantiacus M045]|uniref:Uncharacterized protein n=1 Tax=Streptomyces griseoaurantiacus M045 TaxID=996637 RepID=F3ND46_9ACTN|nr:hypothetical protein SGM_1060 [Streptomyces griseoaurantiacus M045]